MGLLINPDQKFNPEADATCLSGIYKNWELQTVG